MNNFWCILKPWIDRNYYAFTTLTILIALFSFYHYFSKDKIRNDNDLLKIEGKIAKYSFNHGSRSRMYYLWLDNYNCTFQIPADYLHLFDENHFRRNVKRYDKIYLYVSKSKLNELNNDIKLFVYHVSDNRITYLSKMDTIRREKKSFDIYAGVGFFLAGLIYYLIRRFLWKPKYAINYNK